MSKAGSRMITVKVDDLARVGENDSTRKQRALILQNVIASDGLKKVKYCHAYIWFAWGNMKLNSSQYLQPLHKVQTSRYYQVTQRWLKQWCSVFSNTQWLPLCGLSAHSCTECRKQSWQFFFEESDPGDTNNVVRGYRARPPLVQRKKGRDDWGPVTTVLP